MTDNKTAIITGATSGIGSVFAQTLAKRGWNLVLTGRRKERLLELEKELSLAHKVKVRSVTCDLSNNREIDNFLNVIDHCTSIELLVNNAGFGSIGDYFENSYAKQQQMLQVHIVATTRIIHHIVPKMPQNGKSGIINVASLSAFFPAPKSYFYCSSKAFLVTFTECLNIDLATRNIHIQALCPGFTDTEFHSRQGIAHSDSYLKRKLFWKSPQQVVDKSLQSLNKKSVICIPGYFNRILYRINKLLPRTFYYKLAEHNSDTFLKRTESEPAPKKQVLMAQED